MQDEIEGRSDQKDAVNWKLVYAAVLAFLALQILFYAFVTFRLG